MRFEKEKSVKGLFRNRVTGIYYLRKSRIGRADLFLSLRTNSRHKAILTMNQVLEDWYRAEETKREVTIEELRDELLEIYQSKAQQTYENFECITRVHILPYFMGTSISRVAGRIPHYCSYQKTKNSKRKIAHDVRYLHKILQFAVATNRLDSFVRYKLDPIERQHRAGREYTNDEIQRILIAASKWPATLLQIEMQLYMGMRSGEARLLKWKYIIAHPDSLLNHQGHQKAWERG